MQQDLPAAATSNPGAVKPRQLSATKPLREVLLLVAGAAHVVRALPIEVTAPHSTPQLLTSPHGTPSPHPFQEEEEELPVLAAN